MNSNLGLVIFLANLLSLVFPIAIVWYYLAKGYGVIKLAKPLVALGCIGSILKQYTIEGHPHIPHTEIMIAITYFIYIGFVLMVGLSIKFIFTK